MASFFNGSHNALAPMGLEPAPGRVVIQHPRERRLAQQGLVSAHGTFVSQLSGALILQHPGMSASAALSVAKNCWSKLQGAFKQMAPASALPADDDVSGPVVLDAVPDLPDR